MVFTGNDLRLLSKALAHARRGRRIMIANIRLALLFIAAMFPPALTGALGLAGVVLVHEIAEVVVILNGLRAGHAPQLLAPSASNATAAATATVTVPA